MEVNTTKIKMFINNIKFLQKMIIDVNKYSFGSICNTGVIVSSLRENLNIFHISKFF